MHQVHLTDQAYNEARKRAREAGFTSVDEYVEDVLTSEVGPQTENLDHLFTPGRLAQIDKANSQIEAGQYQSAEHVSERLKKLFKG